VLWGAGGGEAKDSYLKEAEARLSEWNAKVERLEKRSEKAGAKTRLEIDRDLRSVRKQLEKIHRSLNETAGSRESGLKKFSRTTDEAFQNVKRTFQKAVTVLKNNEPEEEKP
jgi:small-conductance mechanosensitive channel